MDEGAAFWRSLSQQGIWKPEARAAWSLDQWVSNRGHSSDVWRWCLGLGVEMLLVWRVEARDVVIHLVLHIAAPTRE